MADQCDIPNDIVDCEWGCTSDLGVHVNCPKHNPINTELHDAILKIEEPIRAQLRAVNTTENLRKRVVATLNGNSDTAAFGHMNDTFG